MAGRPPRAPRLEAALERVDGLKLDDLRAEWLRLHGTPAPATFRVALLRAALAYTLQERALGGLKSATRNLLRRVADQADRPRLLASQGVHVGQVGRQPAVSGDGVVPDSEHSPPPDRPARRQPRRAPSGIKPGTRLLRVWQGRAHEVLVQAEGVSYGGQAYRSLSEVARVITGQRWSGPLFFGLKARSGREAAAAAATTTPAPVRPPERKRAGGVGLRGHRVGEGGVQLVQIGQPSCQTHTDFASSIEIGSIPTPRSALDHGGLPKPES